MTEHNQNPEQKARDNIDKMLAAPISGSDLSKKTISGSISGSDLSKKANMLI